MRRKPKEPEHDEHGRPVGLCLGGCGGKGFLDFSGGSYYPAWCESCLDWRRKADLVLETIPSEEQRKWLLDETKRRRDGQ